MKCFAVKRKQYNDEKKKKMTTRSGQAAASYIGKWKYFEALSFLDSRCPDVQHNVLGLEQVMAVD